ncbi:MAG: hypothetical protein ABIH82_03140, partial [Candidatus Woesearchaeota archaeon]
MKTKSGVDVVQRIFILLVIALFVNLPIVSALEISNVRTEDVTDTYATVKWDTDQPANSFLKYGETAESMSRIGDANLLYSHRFLLENLDSEKSYLYSVESNSIVDDNNGELYSFTTLAPDIEAPELLVSLPESVKGNRVDISGRTEPGVEVKLYLNNVLKSTATAIFEEPVTPETSNTPASSSSPSAEVDVAVSDLANLTPSTGSAIFTSNIFGLAAAIQPGLEGVFTFSNVPLVEGQNNVKVEAVDNSGNMVNFTGVVFADSTGPRLEINELPKLISDKKVKITGNVTEESDVEVFVNNRSAGKEESVTTFEFEIFTDDGENTIRVVATDKAGWESTQAIKISSDSLPPQINFELTSGSEYYEGRADTDIVGETKPGAKVYLYMFRQEISQERLDFSHAIKVIEADENGEFTFSEVSFPPPPFLNWEDLAPREVPAGLEEILISPLSNLEQDQRQSYKVYLIAEDSLGRTAYAERSVNINSCFTGNAFDIMPIVEFQAPFKLNPGLMEEGRETIQAVFNISYRGASVGFTDPNTGREQKSYEIVGTPHFQKACTPGMSDNEDYKMGCRLLPPSLKAVPNDDKTSFYVTANLQRADEFVSKDEGDSVWDDFQKRRLKMPIKIMINYRERNDYSQMVNEGTWSQAKTEVFCYDLTYFVDVPIESEDMLPDFLVDGALPALNATINAIETIKPYLRTIMIVTGVTCISAFLTKMVVKVYRIFMQNFEPWRPSDEEEKCPSLAGQYEYYLEDTITDWGQLEGHPDLNGRFALPPDYSTKKLDDVCPNTASAWEIEEFFDQAFRWTCDRFFCSAAPAAWTAKADEIEVRNVIQKQKECAATASCVTLEKQENCRDSLEKNPTKSGLLINTKDAFECYRDAEGVVYYKDNKLNADYSGLNERDIWLLSPVDDIGKIGTFSKGNLLAYAPGDSQDFCTAPDISCDTMCGRVGNYKPVTDGYYIDNDGSASTSNIKKAAVGTTTTSGVEITDSTTGTTPAASTTAAGSASPGPVATPAGAPDVITFIDSSGTTRTGTRTDTGQYLFDFGKDDYMEGTYDPKTKMFAIDKTSPSGTGFDILTKTTGGELVARPITYEGTRQPSCYRENELSFTQELLSGGSDIRLENPQGETVKDGK